MEIDVQDEDLKIIKTILRNHIPHDAKVWVFGSRAGKDKAKPFSDLDLAFDFNRKITLDEFASLTTAFENSLLPYKVDVVDLWTVDNTFKDIINDSKTQLIFHL